MKKEKAPKKKDRKPLWLFILMVLVIVAMILRTYKPSVVKKPTVNQTQQTAK